MRRRLALVVAIAAVALGLLVPAPASASCVGPQLTTVDGVGVYGASGPVTMTLVPGASLVVHGRWFFDSCDDTQVTTGCSTTGGGGAADPSKDVELTLTQGSRSWVLGKASAAGRSKEFAIEWDVRVPPDPPPGPATLSASFAKVAVVVG